MSTPDRVVIVGGGPTGTAAALFLIEQGIRVLLLERTPHPHDDPRAATYHPPTLEMLDVQGVTAELHQRGIIAQKWQYRDRREGLVAEFDLAVLERDTRYPYRLQCEQHKLVEMLERRVAASPLAEVRHGAEVVGCAHDESGAEVVVLTAQGEERIRGRYVIGADGGRSVIRKTLGIGFEGFTWPERFLVITTTFDFEPLGFAYSNYTMDPVEWTATFKVPGPDDRGRWRCVFPTDPADDESKLLDFTHAQGRLQGFIPRGEPYDIVHTNLYAVHQRVATCYRAGRVLLAGDASHVNNPLGGMGLNFGIHDVHNLAGKLGRIWRGEADDGLLDQYDRQRRTVAERYLQQQTIANKQTLEERDPAKREERKAEMRRTVTDRDAAHRYLLRTAMIEGLRAADAIA